MILLGERLIGIKRQALPRGAWERAGPAKRQALPRGAWERAKFAQNVCPDVLSPSENKPSGLFPLYRCWRLAGDVVSNAGNVFNLVDDTVRHFFQQFVRQVRPA